MARCFDLLLRACETALDLAIERGVLGAHEAKSSLRHRHLLERLDLIQQNLAFLTESVPADAATVA